MDLYNIFYVFLITLLPGVELRASIPVGVGLGLPWPVVLAVAIATNIILGPVVYFALDFFLPFARKVPVLNSLYERIIIRTRRRAEPFVEKYGFLGIALFVAVPLPGSGSWSGALLAQLIGVKHRKFALANLLGVLIAAAIVSVFTLGIFSLF